ncbi:MAG TPA: hypothetical protein VFM18_02265 [Methanosarcina sp.]|nr:hypothetical protein [Methanosarcina sp.]
MANTQAMCTSFKKELLNGIHAFGTSVVRAATTPDTFMASLRLQTDTVDSTTTTYSATGEVSGTNYTAGGVTISGWAAPSTSGTSAFTTPTAAFTWTGVTLSNPFDAVLIYNSTQGNKAVSVHTFGAQTVTAGNFSITMPVNAAGTALLQIN